MFKFLFGYNFILNNLTMFLVVSSDSSDSSEDSSDSLDSIFSVVLLCVADVLTVSTSVEA